MLQKLNQNGFLEAEKIANLPLRNNLTFINFSAFLKLYPRQSNCFSCTRYNCVRTNYIVNLYIYFS